MTKIRKVLIWCALGAVITVPLILAMTNPLLAWRDPIYIFAGFAGVIAMSLLLVQPLLAAGIPPGLSGMRGRYLHRYIGVGLVLAVVIHIVALWITSPPDVIDVLLLNSPTPFSVWGVVAMWAIFAACLLAALRSRLGLRPRIWRQWHVGLVALAVGGSVVHAMLIEGTMETISKAALCACVVVATLYAVWRLRVWASLSLRHNKK